MSKYEILSVLLGCIATIVSLIVWFGQRKIQKESNDLQRATSELAKKQLEILLREERGKNTARLSVDLFKDGKTYRFRITNISDVDAKDVDLNLLVKPEDSPLVKNDYEAKFPVPKLQPGSSVTLIAAIHLGSPTAYNAVLSWVNPDGTKVSEETYAAL
ncbi:hypothetical protein [Vreelandella piezotolerans]|uniref:Uncharacterized protein n=1 Tax=Vreelandella piezotolerans TaxID=2609667 RepID=A0ABQ6X520_9GAMM|nr:hypothetical protein [Halomonas piezotolerans]KAE8437126.1 hypothetical protein F1978_16480 [Halomonas piezotolerans]QJA23218.1 hypothetical protein GYM47_03380 [Halomonas piezotolerans]